MYSLIKMGKSFLLLRADVRISLIHIYERVWQTQVSIDARGMIKCIHIDYLAWM